MFLEYECYIAAGSHVDIENNENDKMLIEEYASSKVQITILTFLHKRVFQTNALVRTWYKPRDMSARTTASVRGATIHCTDNAERSCGSPTTGGTYT